MTEDDFLKDLFAQLPEPDASITVPNGDDSAAYIPTPGMHQLLACDQLIEGRHYLADTCPQRAGAKLIKRNLSDMAAMGATPRYSIISCNVNPNCTEEWLKKFHFGLLEEAQKFEVQLIGGDLAVSEGPNAFSLTICGESKKPIKRTGSEEGDLLFATGQFGLSFPSEHHLDFTPRINEGKYLANYAKAMIDITDGLLMDSERLLKQAETSLDLELNCKNIPLRQSNGSTASIIQALSDGEDYELIFAINPRDENSLTKNWPFNTLLTKIGAFKKGTGKILNEKQIPLNSQKNKGFDHFSS